MNVANRELCQELYELSEWYEVGYGHWMWSVNSEGKEFLSDSGYSGMKKNTPAYDLGYLLRKLPETRLEIWHDGHAVIKHYTETGIPNKLERRGKVVKAESDTPEDAACKLAIELFKQGVLSKETNA